MWSGSEIGGKFANDHSMEDWDVWFEDALNRREELAISCKTFRILTCSEEVFFD